MDKELEPVDSVDLPFCHKAKALEEAKEAALREKALKEAADLIAADAAGRSGENPPVGPNAAAGSLLLPPARPPADLPFCSYWLVASWIADVINTGIACGK